MRGLSWYRRIWHEVLRWTIGYGYRLWQAPLWMVFFVSIGALSFWGGAESGDFAETRADTVPVFRTVIYSIDAFVPLVDLQQAKYWYPVATWSQWYLMFHIGVGWALTLLLVVGLTGLVRK